ncbi:hypothetical protein FRB90_008765 [Tulasnella sp. 427]|nr:hypothetical protein FRB90_008765 [Tulasnella sp. 427]
MYPNNLKFPLLAAMFAAAGDTIKTGLIKCQNCTYKGPQELFPQRRRGNGYVKTCNSCTKKQDRYNAKRKEKQEAQPEKPRSQTQAAVLRISSREPLPWATLLPKLGGAKTKACEVDVFVDLNPEHPGANIEVERRQRAAALVADIRKTVVSSEFSSTLALLKPNDRLFADSYHEKTTISEEASIINFQFLTDSYIKNPRGLGPGLKRRLDRVLADVNGLVGDAREEKARRKRLRTWDPATPMYINNE